MKEYSAAYRSSVRDSVYKITVNISHYLTTNLTALTIAMSTVYAQFDVLQVFLYR